MPSAAELTGFVAAPPHPAAMLLEHRLWLEAGGLLRSPAWRGEGVPAGDGRPVMLVPGFLAGDASLALLTRWLRDRGYRTRRSEIRLNVGCTMAAVRALEARLDALAARTGRPVTVIGQSRGGTLGKLVAIRRPDLVAGLVTLGSPNLDPVAVNPLVRSQVALLVGLDRLGVPGVLGADCLSGECAEEVADVLVRPFPDDVDYLAVYSRSDGVVDWRACLDPAAEHVEVRGSHIGMGVNREVLEVLGARLPALGSGRLGSGASAAGAADAAVVAAA